MRVITGCRGQEGNLIVHIAAHGIEKPGILGIVHEENVVELVIGTPFQGQGFFIGGRDAVGCQYILSFLAERGAFLFQQAEET